MSEVTNGHDPALPAWLSTITLENAVRARLGDFEKIISVQPTNGNQAGENYSSLVIRLKVEVAINADEIKTTSFVLKAPHGNEAMAAILNKLQLFQKEETVYQKILPKFVEFYKDAGKTVQFAPNAYKFDNDIGVDYVLLEDLHLKRFKNANRIAGLDMEHMQEVLKKLAEFHAASACYVEQHCLYDEEFTVGVFSEANKELLKEFNASGAFLAQLKKWKNATKFYEKLANSDEYLVERLLKDQKFVASEFNVLNHGDCWVNNIMYQYDAFGKIKQTLLIDFQVGKYGSPANDLYYLILSSAAPAIKLTQFDYFVRYYYDHLVENLRLLQYHRPLPKLKNLHTSLYKNGLAAYMVVSKVLPAVILEKTDSANLESYRQDESKMKFAMFANPKYVQLMSDILPWLDNRGLLDWK